MLCKPSGLSYCLTKPTLVRNLFHEGLGPTAADFNRIMASSKNGLPTTYLAMIPGSLQLSRLKRVKDSLTPEYRLYKMPVVRHE